MRSFWLFCLGIFLIAWGASVLFPHAVPMNLLAFFAFVVGIVILVAATMREGG